MKNQDLDELVRRKMNVSSKVPEHIWDRIETALEEQGTGLAPVKKPFWSLARMLAAGIAAAILVTAGWWTLSLEQDPVDQPDQFLTKEDYTPASSPPVSGQDDRQVLAHRPDQDQPTHVNDMPILDDRQRIRSQNDTLYPQAQEAAFSAAALEQIRPDVLPELTVTVQVPEARTINIKKLENIQWLEQESSTTIHSTENHIGLKDQDMERMSFDPFTRQQDSRRTTRDAKQLYYGVSGGYNYGSLEQGGAVAFNTRKNLNEKIFIDGAVGLVLNNSSPYQANFSGDFIAYKSKPQMINSTDRNNKFSNSDAFYFLQVNPTVGINLAQFLDVSVGPDYQQMLTNANSDVVMFQESKLLPKHDLGLTGKAEFGLNQNLKVGILFREGITPIITNNSNISNRRYIQLQLKVQIPRGKD